MSRRVVNVDSGSNSGSLSSRFESIEKASASLKSKPARAVQTVAPSRPVGGINKRAQQHQNPRGGAPAKAIANFRGTPQGQGRVGGPRDGARGGRGGRIGRGGPGGRDGRGAGRGPAGRGGAASRGRGGAKPKKPLSKEDLDKELDSYMFKDEKIGQDLLDKELELYMSSRGEQGNEQQEATN
eukprot:TRINITY_DN319_c0_g2_i1.p1 TRINITY_DN319_c0_g2~~TRINITY_DN319_c0_g2_i1.p1  ORF type:complete len:190 (+),score=50.92 TRINITY_DN319_c0_g2_i1:24-572(+)